MEKSGGPSLNPDAVEYIPLSRRVADYSSTGNDLKEVVVYMNQQHQQEAVSEGMFIHGSTSECNRIDDWESYMLEQFVMDLDHLKMLFPSMSEESLGDLLYANHGDVAQTAELLHEMERDNCYSLDTGDVIKPGSTNMHTAAALALASVAAAESATAEAATAIAVAATVAAAAGSPSPFPSSSSRQI